MPLTIFDPCTGALVRVDTASRAAPPAPAADDGLGRIRAARLAAVRALLQEIAEVAPARRRRARTPAR